MTVLSRWQLENNATSVLASALASGATALQVSPGHGVRFPSPAAVPGGFFHVTLQDNLGNIEIVRVTARSTDTMTIVREQEGTTSPASFAATTTSVELRPTAELLAEAMLPSSVRYLSTGLGLTFEGPAFAGGTTTDIGSVLMLEDPLRGGKGLLAVRGSADIDVRIHADARDVMIQDIYYPDGPGTIGQVLQLTATNRFSLAALMPTIQNSADTTITKRGKLKFGTGFTLTDDPGNDRTVITGGGKDRVGAVFDWAGTAAPSWGLFCFGQAVSRTTYADLFAVIGTTYGAGDGTTTFNLPDLRGRVTAGKDNMGGTAANRLTAGSKSLMPGATLGGSGGTQAHQLTVGELAAHTHNIAGPTATTGAALFGTGAGASIVSGATGGDQTHTNVQPTLILNKVIQFES